MSARTRRGVYEWYAAGLLFACTVVFYSPSIDNQFLAFDDDVYVTGNPQIQSGLSPQGVAWAFTSGQGANWFPLTRLSHMLDVELFGDDARGHHATSILLHGLNSALVYILCARLTGVGAASFAAGLFFAIHPLHVESVSWISSRKDVLSGLFWLLGMAAYLAYVKRPAPAQYALVAMLYVLALMSKPVAVTFPVVLLLMDYWPLARMQQRGGRAGRREFLALVVEKLPLFAIAAGFSAVTVYVQRAGGTMEELAGVGLAARANNALVAYVRYLEHTLWPAGLLFPYQHLGVARPMWHGALAAAFLIAMTAAAFIARRRAPSVSVGWLWFLVTLLPTIGIIQVGTQAMADRYMYLPILGLFFMLLWPLEGWSRRIPARAALLAISIGLVAVTWQQQRYWRDSETLLTHALALEPANVPARVQLAVVKLRGGQAGVAEYHLREAIAIDPKSVPAWSNLGSTLRMLDRPDEAIAAYGRALELDPGDYAPALNLGSLLVEEGRALEAIPVLERAASHRAENGSATAQLIDAYEAAGRIDDARAALADGLGRFPASPELIRRLEALKR